MSADVRWIGGPVRNMLKSVFSRLRERVAHRYGVAAVIAALLVLQFQGAGIAAGQDDNDGHHDGRDLLWTGTWGASPQSDFFFTPGPSFSNQTIRQIVRISAGGRLVRVRLSNEYGAQPLAVGTAHIGISAGGAAIQAGTDRVLTFNGQPSIVIPPGAPILSDPVKLDVDELTSLAISIYLPQDTGPATWHFEGKQTAYVMTGDTTAVGDPVVTPGMAARFFLTGVEVGNVDRGPAGVVVTFGDSITDGTNSTVDTNHRWPDRLAERLAASRDQRMVGVVNEGISGNRILHNEIGPNALSRIDRDVLADPGVRFMTVLIGINDIGFSLFFPNEAVSSDNIIGGYRQLIARAHSRGIRVYGATLLPFEGAGYFTADGETKRQAVNQWIRSSGEFDAVIDFDALMRDPGHPTQMLAMYDSGDHLHPNDAGYKAMGDSIDLKLFKFDEGKGN
jgi:lysophospholipase L1-like esterase